MTQYLLSVWMVEGTEPYATKDEIGRGPRRRGGPGAYEAALQLASNAAERTFLAARAAQTGRTGR